MKSLNFHCKDHYGQSQNYLVFFDHIRIPDEKSKPVIHVVVYHRRTTVEIAYDQQKYFWPVAEDVYPTLTAAVSKVVEVFPDENFSFDFV